jgi:hypothetical protein
VTVVSLLISGVLLVVMIGIAVYGAVTLPADARIPIHYGIGAYANFASKAVGLVMWPAGGALIFGILTALAEHVITPNHGHHPQVSAAPLIITPIVLALVTAAEWGAIAVARRNAYPPP